MAPGHDIIITIICVYVIQEGFFGGSSSCNIITIIWSSLDMPADIVDH